MIPLGRNVKENGCEGRCGHREPAFGRPFRVPPGGPRMERWGIPSVQSEPKGDAYCRLPATSPAVLSTRGGYVSGSNVRKSEQDHGRRAKSFLSKSARIMNTNQRAVGIGAVQRRHSEEGLCRWRSSAMGKPDPHLTIGSVAPQCFHVVNGNRSLSGAACESRRVNRSKRFRLRICLDSPSYANL